MARQLKQCWHEVHVANPRDLAAVTSSKKKSDRNDAEKLARLARADVRLLNAVYVRSLECQLDFTSSCRPATGWCGTDHAGESGAQSGQD
ncbi:MAG: hypothetical protein KIT83_06255 [Bryobacterales bacterium]|nr:hypothetical protein [Bryobacterales bacterium]